LLRESEYLKAFNLEQILQLATGSKGEDNLGYRLEFINLVKSQQMLAKK
jgi:Ca-activated chloride channel family protein